MAYVAGIYTMGFLNHNLVLSSCSLLHPFYLQEHYCISYGINDKLVRKGYPDYSSPCLLSMYAL